MTSAPDEPVRRRRPRTAEDDAKVDEWIAEMTGLPPTTDRETLWAAMDEVIAEHLHPSADPLPEPFRLPEATEPETKPLAVLAADGPAVAVDRAALESLQQRAAASDRTMLALGKLVGITATDEETVVAAVREALEEAAADGTELVESAELTELRADADAWRTRRWDNLLDQAVRLGKIPPAARRGWRASLDRDPAAVEAELAALPANRVPVTEIGYEYDDGGDAGVFADEPPTPEARRLYPGEATGRRPLGARHA
jgi:hypothetical protein